MISVFLGPPGSGKGTQAKRVSAEKGIPQLSTGDMLRAAIAAGSALGRSAQDFMSRGALVPDEVVIGLIRERTELGDCAGGFILDGFPRTIPQAVALDALLAERARKIDSAILFQIDDSVLVARLTGRRTCVKCGTMYHVESLPPREAGICDQCGSKLIQREDDREDVIRKRLSVYHHQTSPLVDYYSNQDILSPVDASASPDAVFASVSRKLGFGRTA
jgi:adenylate kinase